MLKDPGLTISEWSPQGVRKRNQLTCSIRYEVGETMERKRLEDGETETARNDADD